MGLWYKFQRFDKKIRRLVYAGIMLVFYAMVGFLLLPLIIKPIIIDELSVVLNREVSLKSLEINPFSVSVTLHSLSVADKHADKLFGFEQLHVNFQPTSLLAKVVAFDEIVIVRPDARIILLSTGEYNFSDLISRDKDSKKAAEDNDESWVIAIDKFRYIDGVLNFTDKNRATVFNSQIADINLSLDGFSTRPGEGNKHHFKAETRRGSSLSWEGEFSLSPLKSRGHVELSGKLDVVSEYLQDQVQIKIDSGKLNVETDYSFLFSDNAQEVVVSRFLASVTEMDIRKKADSSKVLGWNELTFDMQKLDVFNRKVVINKIAANKVFVYAERDRQTNIDFADLFVLQNLKEKSQSDDVATDENWDVLISHISINESPINVSDNSVEPIAKHKLFVKNIDMKNLRPFTDDKTSIEASFILNGKGVLELGAEVLPLSKKINLHAKLSELLLQDFQSYVNGIARADILQGELGFDLNVLIDASKPEPDVDLQGDVDVSILKVRDKKLKEELVSWKKLALNKISFKYPQQVLSIDSVDIVRPYLRLVMNGGGETNIQQLLVAQTEAKKENKSEKTLQASIKKISIIEGKMDFSDSSLQPKFNAGVYGLHGHVSGLSSAQLSRASLDLKGKVDKYAPVTIKGDINPLTEDKFTDIKVLFKGIELTTFTPYSGKFAGYKIEKGKLTLDLNYHLSKNELVAENRVILDQLTLGEETDSEKATSLPVKFALSLLKDSKGVIDFNLPVRGDINDPDFHYGSLVWGALGNLIVGIVSSPFSALANLVGGDGEGLDYIVFSAGDAELSIAEKHKLDSLAKALQQRPELHLEIRGVSSSLVDRDEMAYSKVLSKLKIQPAALSVPLNSTDQEKLVDYYENLSNKPADSLLPEKNNLDKSQKTDFIYNKALAFVLSKTQISETELRLLAGKRAEKIQKYLIEEGGVSPDNVFLLDSKTQLDSEFEDVENAQLKLPLGLKAK